MKNIFPKIIFLGTPEFSVPALLKLIELDYHPILVMTQPDKPAGRNKALTPPPIKKIALDHKLPLAQPKNKKELTEIFEKLDCDLGVLVAFGQILPQIVLNKPRLGILNIHPSLLPQYRGSSPIQSAIMNGDKKTGISIIKLSDKVDAGDIVAQAELELDQSEDAEILHDKLANLGAKLLLEILPDYLAGKIIPKIQDDSRATFTVMINREDGQIDWSKTAGQIERQSRAFFPWPGVFTYLNGKRLKIAKLSVLDPNFKPNQPVGTVFLGENESLAVQCGQGQVALEKLQLEGKKELTAKDFIVGNKIIGKVLNFK